jgi:hypothetical protein
MKTEDAILNGNPPMCKKCGVLFNWDDPDTKDYVTCIDDEGYCMSCADKLEEEGLRAEEDREEVF